MIKQYSNRNTVLGPHNRKKTLKKYYFEWSLRIGNITSLIENTFIFSLILLWKYQDMIRNYILQFTCRQSHLKVSRFVNSFLSALWSEWGAWSCRMEFHGVCNMTRSRKCPTGRTDDCGTNSLDHKPCDNTTCPSM